MAHYKQIEDAIEEYKSNAVYYNTNLAKTTQQEKIEYFTKDYEIIKIYN